MLVWAKIKSKPVLGILSAAFLITFFITIGMALNLPIYTDEIDWKLTASRIFLDDGKLLYLFPACENSWLMDSPLSWYPARWIDAFLYQDMSNPYILRLTGVLFYLYLISLWGFILSRISRISLSISILLVASFFSVGVLPFLMVLNRPEQSILIWLTSSLLIIFWPLNGKDINATSKLAIFILLVFAVCMMLGSHPKAIYFIMPIIAIGLWKIRSKFLIIFFLITVFYSVFETIKLWSRRTNCEESPWLTGVINGFNIQPSSLLTSPYSFIENGIKNLVRWQDYITSTFPITNFKGYWLPTLAPDYSQFILEKLPNTLVWISFSILLLTLLFLVCWNGALGKKTRLINFVISAFSLIIITSSYYIEVGLLLLLVIIPILYFIFGIYKNNKYQVISALVIFGTVTYIFIQNLKNFYEASLFWPLCILAFIFSISSSSQKTLNVIKNYIFPILMISAIASGILRIEFYTSYFNTWEQDQKNYKNYSAKLQNFAKEECGITDTMNRLIVDDFTYPSFWRGKTPMISSYLYGWWGTGADYFETLRRINPEGLIVHCQGFPNALKVGAKIGSEFCCMSGENLNKIIKVYFLNR